MNRSYVSQRTGSPETNQRIKAKSITQTNHPEHRGNETDQDSHIGGSIPSMDNAMRKGVIGNRSYNNDAIETAWRRTINRQLSEDVTAATKVIRRDEYTKLIISTWRDALRKQQGDLPENWINLQPHF